MTATTTAPTRLSARELTLGYTGTAVVQGLDLQIPDGKVTVIVGANACGKSTLLRGPARLLKPRSGAVLLDGEAIHRLATKQVARAARAAAAEPDRPRGRDGGRPGQSWSPPPPRCLPPLDERRRGRRRRGAPPD
ncbi:ATP-binding cassette domain-containing protein [Nocardioides sp. B-3]|uniref:ATP-binding cassette domain-containing protein n=1 Tax=Nocardioides sp. B-3 TaxID=2895565 RepID=UPI003FA5C332